MEEIIINKFPKRIRMYDILLIYKSIISEFIDEFYKKKKAIESRANDLVDLGVECSSLGEVRLTYKFKDEGSIDTIENLKRQLHLLKMIKDNEINFPDYFEEEDLGLIKEEEDFVTKNALDDLVVFCSSFIKNINKDLEDAVKLVKGPYAKYYIKPYYMVGFSSIDNMKLVTYFVDKEKEENILDFIVKTNQDGAEIVNMNDKNKSRTHKRLMKGPQLLFESLPNLVQEYIEKNIVNKNFFSYSVNISKKIDPSLNETTKRLKEKDNLTEEDKQKHKEEIFRKLKELDVIDDKYDNKQIMKPFPIKDYIFFSSNNEDKKEIDSFFKENPGVLKYCNLSFINFDKADIREFDFSNNPEAIINFDSIYNKDITNTNLKNNQSLSSQSLEKVIANGANLMGTGVFVPLDLVFGTENTIFDETCRFSIGIEDISHEDLRKSGYIIMPREYLSKDFERENAIYTQNLAHKNGVNSLFDEEEVKSK